MFGSFSGQFLCLVYTFYHRQLIVDSHNRLPSQGWRNVSSSWTKVLEVKCSKCYISKLASSWPISVMFSLFSPCLDSLIQLVFKLELLFWIYPHTRLPRVLHVHVDHTYSCCCLVVMVLIVSSLYLMLDLWTDQVRQWYHSVEPWCTIQEMFNVVCWSPGILNAWVVSLWIVFVGFPSVDIKPFNTCKNMADISRF